MELKLNYIERGVTYNEKIWLLTTEKRCIDTMMKSEEPKEDWDKYVWKWDRAEFDRYFA